MLCGYAAIASSASALVGGGVLVRSSRLRRRGISQRASSMSARRVSDTVGAGGGGGDARGGGRHVGEHLHAAVVGVGDQQVAAAVDRQPGRLAEVAGTGAAHAPGGEEASVGGELLHAVVVAV